MGRYNEVLAGRYNKLLTRLFSMKGPAPAPQLAGDIAATINFFNGVENRFLESWERFGLVVGIAAVAANTSAIRLRNPPTSNVLMVFEKLSLASPTGVVEGINCFNGPLTTDLAVVTALTGSRFDARTRPQPSLILSSQNTTPAPATPSNQFANLQLLASSNWELIWDENMEIPLLPGDALQFQPQAVNLQISLTFWWRE